MDDFDFSRAERRRLRRLERRLDRAASRIAPSARPAREASPGTLLSVAVTVLLVVAAVAFVPGSTTASIRALVGLDGPLGAPPDVPSGAGSYAFLTTQRGSDVPVTYSRCRPIRVEINPEDAPVGYRDLVDTAIERTSEATGFQFEVVGTTDSRDFRRDVSVTGAAPPVLVAWATGDEYEPLAGDIAGVGGSTAVSAPSGRLEYVTGAVVLDSETFAELTIRRDFAEAQAIVDHEFAHLVGLGHVDDPGELMFHDNLGRTTYGPGDREGLARLGRVPCR